MYSNAQNLRAPRRSYKRNPSKSSPEGATDNSPRRGLLSVVPLGLGLEGIFFIFSRRAEGPMDSGTEEAETGLVQSRLRAREKIGDTPVLVGGGGFVAMARSVPDFFSRNMTIGRDSAGMLSCKPAGSPHTRKPQVSHKKRGRPALRVGSGVDRAGRLEIGRRLETWLKTCPTTSAGILKSMRHWA